MNMIKKRNTTNLTNTILCKPDDTWVIFDDNGGIVEQGSDINNYCNRLYSSYCYHCSQGDFTNQFAEGRYAIALLEGTYNLDISIGYYTSLIGMAQQPDAIAIKGKVQVPNSANGRALDNFWRSCEGVKIDVSGDGLNYWRVSQAAPFRRNIVNGTLVLGQSTETEEGYASGGYIGECTINKVNGGHGDIDMGTQQQFYIGTSKFENLKGGAWNFLLGGTVSEPISNQQLTQGKKLNTVIDHVDKIAGKPYLIANDINDFELVIPKVMSKVKGALSYDDAFVNKTKNFTIIDPSVSIETINEFLSEGVSIVFSPGIYSYSSPIIVTKNNTVLLGIGLATIVPTQRREAVIVTGKGCRIAGIMIQAGVAPGNMAPSPSLITIGGTEGKTDGDINNPTILQDVFCRVGGPNLDGECDTMIIVNQSHVIMENTWIWRADHTDHVRDGVGVNNSKVDHCLIVNGDNVTCYCLMIEHTLKELCVWNGNNGKIFFIQSELAYDVGEYTTPWDYPGLRVNGSDFFGTALGFYSFFSKSRKATDTFPVVSSALVVQPDSIIDSAMSVFLDPATGGGVIKSVINGKGQQTDIKYPGVPSWGTYNKDEYCKICEEQL